MQKPAVPGCRSAGLIYSLRLAGRKAKTNCEKTSVVCKSHVRLELGSENTSIKGVIECGLTFAEQGQMMAVGIAERRRPHPRRNFPRVAEERATAVCELFANRANARYREN